MAKSTPPVWKIEDGALNGGKAVREGLGRFVPSRRLIGMALTALSLSGCANFWDDVTSRDFHFGEFFHKPNPYLVLRDSDDGNRRARALRALEEPKQHGGNDRDQDAVVNILTA